MRVGGGAESCHRDTQEKVGILPGSHVRTPG